MRGDEGPVAPPPSPSASGPSSRRTRPPPRCSGMPAPPRGGPRPCEGGQGRPRRQKRTRTRHRRRPDRRGGAPATTSALSRQENSEVRYQMKCRSGRMCKSMPGIRYINHPGPFTPFRMHTNRGNPYHTVCILLVFVLKNILYSTRVNLFFYIYLFIFNPRFTFPPILDRFQTGFSQLKSRFPISEPLMYGSFEGSSVGAIGPSFAPTATASYPRSSPMRLILEKHPLPAGSASGL